jgi:hypothetical protein
MRSCAYPPARWPGQQVAIYEVREMLDPGIARLAAERATKADIAVLCRMLERHERRAAARRYTSDDDTQFHMRLARISGNPVLSRLLEGVMTMLAEVREPALRTAEKAGLRVNLTSHWEILRAVGRTTPTVLPRWRSPGRACGRRSDHAADGGQRPRPLAGSSVRPHPRPIAAPATWATRQFPSRRGAVPANVSGTTAISSPTWRSVAVWVLYLRGAGLSLTQIAALDALSGWWASWGEVPTNVADRAVTS